MKNSKEIKIIPLKINQNELENVNVIIKARIIYLNDFGKTLIVKGVKSPL